MNIKVLKELSDHAHRIGLDLDLVQASGGNVSWKDNGTMLIKASGKRLVDAKLENIFCTIDYKTLNNSEIVETEDFSKFAQGLLTPSIETNFHLLIPQSFVTHLHSLGAIAMGLLRNDKAKSFLERKEIVSILYERPGVALSREIESLVDFNFKIILLKNHGIIFSGEDINQIEALIQNFETESRAFLATLPRIESFPDWSQILTGGVLTPDEGVFLGKVPFVKSETPQGLSVSINSLGELVFPLNYSEERIQMAHFYVRLAKLIEKKTQVSYLERSEVNALLSWDKEIKRIEMAK